MSARYCFAALFVMSVLTACTGGGIKTPGSVSAVDYGGDNRRQAVYLSGPLSKISANEQLRSADILIVDSPGGRISEAFVLARHLQENATTLIVPNGAKCMSACLILMANAERVLVGPDAQFLIHAASRHGSYSGEGTQKIRGYLIALGWPAPLVDKGTHQGGEHVFDGREAIREGIAQGYVCGNLDKPSSLHECELKVHRAGIRPTRHHGAMPGKGSAHHRHRG